MAIESAPDKPEHEDQRHGHRQVVGSIAVLIVLPLIYIASIGPAVLIHSRSGETTRQIIEGIYWPLEYAAKSTGTEKCFEPYCRWWRSLGR